MYHILLEKRKTNMICDISCLRILKNDVLDLIVVFPDASFVWYYIFIVAREPFNYYHLGLKKS